MSDESPRVDPFSNGSEFLDWQSANCDRCSKRHDYEAGKSHCPIEEALSFAAIGDGTIDRALAERAGLHARPWPEPRCREYMPIPVASGIEGEARIVPCPGQLVLFGPGGEGPDVGAGPAPARPGGMSRG